ncbi:hypothetical protein XENORESO_013997, partial [Xenotaenia resolanae]
DLNTLRNILLYHFSEGIFINGGLQAKVTNLLKSLQGKDLQVKSENNSIHVNLVKVPDSDLMATNGVIHVVKNVLYPPDLPVGRQDLLMVLQKLIRYIKIKFISGFTYAEIPLTFIKRIITTTHYIEVPEAKTVIIEEQPSVRTVTRVIEGKPSLTQVTRVIKTEPSVSKVIVEGDQSSKKVTRVIGRQPSVSKVTRVIGGREDRTNKRTETGGTIITTVKEPQIIAVPDLAKLTSISENPTLLKEESAKITKIIQEGRGFAAARKGPAGIRRRAKLVKHHHKPKE